MSTIGWMVAAINYEIDKYVSRKPYQYPNVAGTPSEKYKDFTRDPEKYPNAMDDPTNAKFYTNFIRMITLTTTIVAIYFLYQRHKSKALWKAKHFDDDVLTQVYRG